MLATSTKTATFLLTQFSFAGRSTAPAPSALVSVRRHAPLVLAPPGALSAVPIGAVTGSHGAPARPGTRDAVAQRRAVCVVHGGATGATGVAKRTTSAQGARTRAPVAEA